MLSRSACRLSWVRVRSLPLDVRADLQWGVHHLAATASDGSLKLFRHSNQGAVQLIASLAPALAVQRSQVSWLGPANSASFLAQPSASCCAFSPTGRWLAVVHAPSSAQEDLALVLLDAHKAGAVVWSYTLQGSSGAEPGEHYLGWSADGTALVVSITAGFLRKWHLSLSPSRSKCCKESCPGAGGRCPSYRHVAAEADESFNAEAMMDMMGMLQSLIVPG